MDQRSYELGKQAGAIVSRSVRICLGKPGSQDKVTNALKNKKHHSGVGPWRRGRKPNK